MRRFVVLALLLALTLAGCSAGEAPREEIPVSAARAMERECAVYMESRGYLVPVTVRAEWGDMYSSLARTLKTGAVYKGTAIGGVIPGEAQVSVKNENGALSVYMGSVPEMERAQAEKMLTGTAATLLQFGGVSSVKFEINGSAESFCGQDISQPVTSVNVNPAYSIGDYKPFKAWYKTADDMLIPITKETPDPCAEVFIKAMMKAPKDAENLKSLFPMGTLLNSAVLSEGVLTLDFSGEFYETAAVPEAERLLMQGIIMTCAQLDGVEDVVITVEGADYQSEYTFEETASSVFSNSIEEPSEGEELL